MDGSDQAATVRSLVTGKSTMAFDTRVNKVSEDDQITDAGVEVALNLVATTVFSHPLSSQDSKALDESPDV